MQTRLKAVLMGHCNTRAMLRRLVCAVVVASSLAADAAADKAATEKVCALEPYDAAALPILDALLGSHLTPKHYGQVVELMKDPCDAVKQGIVMNSFKMRNTGVALGKFLADALRDLEADQVANFYELVPADPRSWVLKAFVAGLACTVKKGESTCAEVETNELLALFEKSRSRYAERLLEAKGLELFPVQEALDPESLGDYKAVTAHFCARMKIEDEATVAWLAEELKPTDADVAKDETKVFAEPLWFRAVAAQCRQKAAAYAPNHGDTAASMADLDHAVDAALYAWYFQSCHRNSIIHKYEHKDDPPPEDAAAAAAAKPAGEL